MTTLARSVAFTPILLAVSLTAAGDPCEGLRDRPPHDPRSSECFREWSRESARVMEERLEGWLASDPDNPWILAALGGILLDRDPGRARPALETALETFVSRKAVSGEAYARILLARDHQRHRRVAELEEELAAARALPGVTGDPVLAAWLAYLEGNELSLQSRYEESLFIARQVLQLESFVSLPPALQRMLFGRLVVSARAAERYSEAMAFARGGAAVCSESPECQAVLAYDISEIMRGMASDGLASRADAVRATLEAYELARATRKLVFELDTLCALGLWTLPPESIEWNRLCAERAEAMRCPDVRLRAQLRGAEAAARADPRAVEGSIRIAKALMEEERRFSYGLDPASILRTLAALHALAGDRAEAVAALEEAIELREKIRDRAASPEARSDVISRSAPYYYALASLLALEERGRDIEKTFAVMEALRARALLDLRAAASGADPLAVAGAEGLELARTIEAIAAVQSRLANVSLPEDGRDAALRELDRLEVREEELASRIARADPTWAMARRPRPASLGEAREALRADEALILLQIPPPGESDAWALLVTRRTERIVRLPSVESFAALRLYLGAIAHRREPPPEMEAALQKALLSPVIEALPSTVRRLVIVPDGPVDSLPLGALPDPGSGRRLVERYELSLVPSATLLVSLRAGGVRPLQPAALGLADVAWGAEVPEDVERASLMRTAPIDLPRSRAEVQSMVEAVGGASRALFDSRANEADLKRLDLAPFGILHFATHAIVNASRPSRSAILLAPGDSREDGLLQPREIASLPLAGKLVVISACSSAGGRSLRGEGPLSIARSFLGAGARTVIGTIWPVRDSEAGLLAERFYARLARGDAAATALAAAQREMLGAGLPPAAWAGFVLIGDGEVSLPPRSGPPSSSSAWALTILLGLAGLAGLASLLAWSLHKR